jgi:Ca-activated chloride channel family protein
VILGLARPRAELEVREERLRGRNVVLTLDISSSMKAPDFSSGNRLVAAKRVLADFIGQRSGDFLGLVLFASRPFMQAPLTNSRAVLLDLLDRADMGMLADGTAIGAALAMSENQLKDLPRGSGVIVLVTDGGNNTGHPDPLLAAEAAKALGIRVYTIGVSSRVPVRLPAFSRPATMEAADPLTDRDETLLRRTAAISGGQYFRAADDTSLARVMGEIDALEKTELRLREVRSYRELFPYFLVPAMLLLGLELLLTSTWLRRLP